MRSQADENVIDMTEVSLLAIRYGCYHDKPSAGHCCFVFCPNFAGRRNNA